MAFKSITGTSRICVFIFILVFSYPAISALVTFSGTVNSVTENSSAPFIEVGAKFTGYYSYDNSLTNTTPGISWRGEYEPLASTGNILHVEIGEFSLTKDIDRIAVWNDKPSCTSECSYYDAFVINAGAKLIDLSTTEEFIQFLMNATNNGLPAPTLLTSTDLPTSALDLALAGGTSLVLRTEGVYFSGAIETVNTVPIPTVIDIKPSKKPENVISFKKDKNLKVAIVGSEAFDVLQVDPATVKFDSNKEFPASPIRFKGQDYNRDGYPDLILTFKLNETGIACGDTEATLTGDTYGGKTIEGSDTFTVEPCP